jgi:serine protease AprX
MGKINVLIEVEKEQPEAFAAFTMAMDSEIESLNQGEDLVSSLSGLGLEVLGDAAPIPMFPTTMVVESETFLTSVPQSTESAFELFREEAPSLAAFDTPDENPDIPSETMVVSAQIEVSNIEKLLKKKNIKGVYPNSPLSLFCQNCGSGFQEPGMHFQESVNHEFGGEFSAQGEGLHPFDLALSSGGIDCRPFRQAVPISTLRTLLGVNRVWNDGFRGQNIVVGIIDEGINGSFYPVIGGFNRPNSTRPIGSAGIGSHGSMCAADILVAAPAAKLYDYPFLGVPDSGGAMTMFQAVLDQRRRDGTPNLTNNSYGFVGIPPQAQYPHHEVYDINHPLHRKIREVVASGCPTLFAAGNCGSNCPSSKCHPTGTGPRRSINGSNSLSEVITVAAVNSRNERIGYSSQGPSFRAPGFFQNKPDISSYSHFFGNFGPGRPAGGDANSFDNGTSAATPVASGVVALLLSAFPGLTPQRLKNALIRGAVNIGAPGWDADTGFGVVNAAASYILLRNGVI